ncbi:MAG TPA: hypothetical protein VHS78_18605 [Candidatus Elarobacter sp.]|jgi:hypothetical protein|nr:hypothetical protein [Candidatus Elarobacter sp.]
MLPAVLLAVDFDNFTYRVHPCMGNVPVPAVMRKGSFSYEDKNMGAGFDLRVRSVQRGSLRAGTRQAVVVIVCDLPLGGGAEAYAFDERPSGAVLLGTIGSTGWGGDWGQGPASMRFRFANHRLTAEQCADNDCVRRKTTTYALRGTKLVTLSVAMRANLSR